MSDQRDSAVTGFRVTIPPDEEDLATAALWGCGTLGLHVQPSDEAGLVALVAYFATAPDLEARVAEALAPLAGARLEPAVVPDVDWVTRFREGFRSFPVGRFVIAPPWDLPAHTEPGLEVLVVEPGRAFGTGTHETTRLCLRALEDLATRGPLGRTLDLGTGTGLLAVAASRLGAREVVAVDNDREAVESARRHAQLNAVDVRIVHGDGGRPFRAAAFDLVLANVTAPLLLERRDEIGRLVRPDGFAVLSGLLTEDAPRVRESYLVVGTAEVRTDGEWACLGVHRR